MKLAHRKPGSGAASSRPAAPAVRPAGSRQDAGTTGEHDPFARAERLFGAPAQLVLVRDVGPALSFSGWTVSTSRAESLDHATRMRRDVEVDIMFSATGQYVISERITLRLADGALRLNASVAGFGSARELRWHCEAPSFDPQTDAARAAALDHAARIWPWLRTVSRRPHSERATLPFAL